MIWTHVICEECFLIRCSARSPVRIMDPDPETCCFCGKENKDGIYIRCHQQETKHCKCTEDTV